MGSGQRLAKSNRWTCFAYRVEPGEQAVEMELERRKGQTYIVHNRALLLYDVRALPKDCRSIASASLEYAWNTLVAYSADSHRLAPCSWDSILQMRSGRSRRHRPPRPRPPAAGRPSRRA